MNRKNICQLLDKPIWQLNGHEFFQLMRESLNEFPSEKDNEPRKRFVFGLEGIRDLFGCSKSTAERIKQSGIIDKAIKQVKRTIVVDAELALELFGNSMKNNAGAAMDVEPETAEPVSDAVNKPV